MGVPLAEELVPWDVDRWLTQAAQVMHDPLIGLLRGKRSGSVTMPPETESYDLASLGRELYDAIFQGTIRDSWMIAQGVAQNHKEILRLRLGLKDDRLPLLPWEVLHDGARPLATNTDVVFSRYRSVTNRAPNTGAWQHAADEEHPLRILMVLAAPTDQEILQLHQEAQHLQQELQHEIPGRSGSNLELTILDQPGREQLTQALEHGHYDILHYAGHSDLSASGGDLYLVSDKTGLTEVLSGDDLAGLLVNNGVRMAVFNSCQGAYSATASESGSSSGSLADALLKRNVPAVLAMAEQIPDEVALNLSRLFYRNLKQRCPIDLSLSRARQGLLSSYGSDQLYWALPILYMHAEFNGYLQASPPVLPGPSEDWETGVAPNLPLNNNWEPDLSLRSWPDASMEPHLDDIDWSVEEQTRQDQEMVKGLLEELQRGQPQPDLDLELTDPLATAANAPVSPLPTHAGTRKTDPQQADAEDFWRLGQRLQAEGDLLAAMEAYRNAIVLNPEFAEAYSSLGETFEQDGALNEAVLAYKMALRFKPDLTQAAESLDRLATATLPEHGTAAAANPEFLLDQIKQQQSLSSASKSIDDRIYDLAPKSEARKARIKWTELANGKTIAMGIATIAVLGSVWWLAIRPDKSPNISRSPSQETIADNTQNKELVAIATETFSQRDLRKGTEAVAQLLERGALNEAEVSLSAVSSRDVSVPAISFLRGRLAWESIKRPSPTTFSPEDALRDWSTAVREQPNNIFYRNTLGFGFYGTRNWEEAERTWNQAAKQLRSQDVTPDDPELLTAYAGQALALAKQAQQVDSNDPQKLQAALKLRDQVLEANPIAFQPQQLAQEWRWTANMITDWANLLAEKS
jgi:tetratricopeptide (TPR) repeat protein